MQGCETDKPRFVVGLGNPGRRYARTRHNVGFRVLDELAGRWRLAGTRKAFGGQLGEVMADLAGSLKKVKLFWPLTYMNRSGEAVVAMASFYKANRQDILVVLDDMDLPFGMLRSRASGSAGGHKGLSDVLAMMGSDEVPRLRLGIGQAPPEMDAMDFVLAPFRPDEEQNVEEMVRLAAQAVEDWILNGIGYVMNEYNRKPDD